MKAGVAKADMVMKFGSEPAEYEVNCRELIRLSLMSSALLAGSSQLLEGEETDSASPH